MNPNTKSAFMWKSTSTDHYSLTYTNWNEYQPDYKNGNEACINVWTGQNYHWNDQPCQTKTCFVCELEC